MPLRRPHAKSRAGCTRCKERHIKCDEAQPVCGACARYNVPCIPKAARRPAKLAQSVTSQSASPGSPSVSSSSEPPALPIWKVELLHHWILELPRSFLISPGFDTAWRGRFVKAALQHDYLLHMMLMLSALHLALTKSPYFTETHRAFILEGCSEATAGFRRAVDNISESNCHVVQGFPFTLSIYALALPLLDREDKSEHAILDELTRILTLIGTNSVVDNKLIPFMSERHIDWWIKGDEFLVGPDGLEPHMELTRALESLHPWIDSSDDEPVVRGVNTLAVQVYVRAIKHFPLRQNLRPITFPTLISPEYRHILGQRNPMALVILAHWAVTLWDCREQWWCSNWGVRVVSVVALFLPERYAGALRYPLEKLNLQRHTKEDFLRILHGDEVSAAELQISAPKP